MISIYRFHSFNHSFKIYIVPFKVTTQKRSQFHSYPRYMPCACYIPMDSPQQQLQEVARATTPPSCTPRQRGGTSRPSAIERNAKAPGGEAAEGRYLSEDAPSFAKMVESAEKRLFRAIVTNLSHVLHHALPKEKSTVYNLRPRAHNFELPWKDTRNFLARQLYSNIYCPNRLRPQL